MYYFKRIRCETDSNLLALEFKIFLDGPITIGANTRFEVEAFFPSIYNRDEFYNYSIKIHYKVFETTLIFWRSVLKAI